MSATHRVHVVEASPSTAKLRITIAHEDETGIPLFRTAMAAMMFESLYAAEEAKHKCRAPLRSSSTTSQTPKTHATAAVHVAGGRSQPLRATWVPASREHDATRPETWHIIMAASCPRSTPTI